MSRKRKEASLRKEASDRRVFLRSSLLFPYILSIKSIIGVHMNGVYASDPSLDSVYVALCLLNVGFSLLRAVNH